MNCDQCLDWINGGLEGADAAAEAHLLECGGCRARYEAWEVLDAELLQHAAGIHLPVHFTALVLGKVDAPQLMLSEREIAARRAQLEQEYAESLASLGFWRRFRDLDTLAQMAVLACIVFAAVWIAMGAVSLVSAWLAGLALSRTALLVLESIGTAGLGAGVAIAVLRDASWSATIVSRLVDLGSLLDPQAKEQS